MLVFVRREVGVSAVEVSEDVLALPSDELSPPAKVLYVALSRYCQEDGGSTLVTRDVLAAATGLLEKGVQRGFKELQERKLIRRHRDHDLIGAPWRTTLVESKRGKK
jgi:hypothetical protein